MLDDRVFRTVTAYAAGDFEYVRSTDLIGRLIAKGLLVPEVRVKPDVLGESAVGASYVLEHPRLPFISYPYEWSFSALKAAALLQLDIQLLALENDVTLADASAYNIQFQGTRPVFIDTLSFEEYRDGSPWVGYRQFCQHFLAPLTLIAYVDKRLAMLLRTNIDGIPLDLAARMLPAHTKLRPTLLMHLHLHAWSQVRNAAKVAAANSSRSSRRSMSRLGLRGLLDSLRSAVEGISWRPKGDWANYYSATNYTTEAFSSKEKLVAEFIDAARPTSVWDLGANTGAFSRIAAGKSIPTVAIDFDAAAVEVNFQQCLTGGPASLLPLVCDLTNPSPGIGWANEERQSLEERGPADLIMALALVHHIAIANNVPLGRVADYFGRLGRHLLIEFVPKGDSQVDRMLRTREDIFEQYHVEAFERAFESVFSIEKRGRVEGSQRALYLMRRR